MISYFKTMRDLFRPSRHTACTLHKGQRPINKSYPFIFLKKFTFTLKRQLSLFLYCNFCAQFLIHDEVPMESQSKQILGYYTGRKLKAMSSYSSVELLSILPSRLKLMLNLYCLHFLAASPAVSTTPLAYAN